MVSSALSHLPALITHNPDIIEPYQLVSALEETKTSKQTEKNSGGMTVFPKMESSLVSADKTWFF